jgi:Phospholipase_D-nuclease N-terminal
MTDGIGPEKPASIWRMPHRGRYWFAGTAEAAHAANTRSTTATSVTRLTLACFVNVCLPAPVTPSSAWLLLGWAVVYSFGSFVGDLLTIIAFLIVFGVWIYVVVRIVNRRDLGLGGKLLWIAFLIFLPPLGLISYLISAGVRRQRNARGLPRSGPPG